MITTPLTPSPLSRKERGIKRALIAVGLILITGLAALASDGTVNKTWQEDFHVLDAYGNGRTNCVASRFSTRTYRSGGLVGQGWSFRNFSSGGVYEATTTPLVTGRYVAFVSYSSAPVGTFTKWVRAYDADTSYAGLDGHMTTQDTTASAIKAKTDNLPASPAATGAAMTLSSAYDAAKNAASQTSVNAIPTTPLLSGDPRLPSTVIATAAQITAAHAATDALIGGIDDDPWDNPGRFLSNYTGLDARLTATHGAGLWSAAGSVTVVPFQGSVSHESVMKAKEVHVVRGDSVAMPYSVGKDITGWTVWFGAKANPSDEGYAVGLRDITAYVTDASTGSGLINLTSSDTDVPSRRYHAEVELRKAGEVNTPLRFYLWVDADVIR